MRVLLRSSLQRPPGAHTRTQPPGQQPEQVAPEDPHL